MSTEQLQREIELTLDMMQTAPIDERDYLIGRLSALLWVAGGGDLLRTDARAAAVQAWERAQTVVA